MSAKDRPTALTLVGDTEAIACEGDSCMLGFTPREEHDENGAVETVLRTARPKRELVKSHPIPRPPTVISAARQPLKRDLRASVPRQTWLELVRERDSRVHTSRPLQVVGGTTPLLRTSRPTCGSTRRGTDRST